MRQLDLFARAQGERQRGSEIERQLAHHHAGLDLRLLAHIEVVAELGESGTTPSCTEGAVARGPSASPFRRDLDLGDAGLDRLQVRT
jgi:hypothetical protein